MHSIWLYRHFLSISELIILLKIFSPITIHEIQHGQKRLATQTWYLFWYNSLDFFFELKVLKEVLQPNKSMPIKNYIKG